MCIMTIITTVFVCSILITITLALTVSGCSGQISATITLLAEWGPSCVYIMRLLMGRTGRNTLHLLGLGGKSVFSSLFTITFAMMVSGGSVQISATIMLLAEWEPSCV